MMGSKLLLPSFGAPASTRSIGDGNSGNSFSLLQTAAMESFYSERKVSGKLGVASGWKAAGLKESGWRNVTENFGSRDGAVRGIQGLRKRSGKEDVVGVVMGANGRNVETAKGGARGGMKVDEVVNVEVEKLSNNSRKIVARISIGAPLESIWATLTDYEHLADFIPGLAVCDLLEKRRNGARLYQVGEQNLALGLKFKAKAVLDCKEKPKHVHEGVVRRDIDFDSVEGDFEVFRGTWRMEQQVSPPSSGTHPVEREQGGEGEESEQEAGKQASRTLLSYILIVQPRVWVPVALIEGRLTSEMKKNLLSIRDRSLQPLLT